MDFTPEQLAKAKAAKSVEELLAYAKEIDFALTGDEAKFYFSQWHKEGELADKELADVSGGSQCIDGKYYSSDYPYYLITTAGNYCPSYVFSGINDPLTIDDGYCSNCMSLKSSGIILYCTYRKRDSDPYR